MLWRYSSTMNGHGLRNTSSPKFVVPQVSEHESGSASSTVSRWSSGSWTDPPVGQLDDQVGRLADRVHRRAQHPASRVGACAASRMCRWTIDAPAASQRTAVSTSSASVVGSCGTSALLDSAPVGATVMRVFTAREPMAGEALGDC